MLKTKTNINITIDTNIYMKAKLKADFNLSGECNEFLKKRLGDEETIKQLEADAISKTRELEYINLELNRQMIKASEQAAKKLSKEQEEAKEEMDSIPIGYSFEARIKREKMFKEKPELKTKWKNATSAQE